MARSRRSCTCAYRKASTAASTPARSSNSTARCTASSRPHATLEGLGYQRTKSDACIYVRSEGGHTHYIALYVDDLLFVSPDLDEIQRIKDGLKREYGIKDLGEAKFILGIQVHRRSNGGIFLSQRAYLEDVLLRLGYADGRTAPTPMQPNLQLAVAPEDHQPTPAFRSRYLQAVGSLMYAMLGPRPNLCYAVGVLGRHAARPDNSHWAAVIRVLAYIKGTLDFGLEFQPDDSPLAGFEAYSDSDWGACPSTSRSTMGYTFVLASGAVSWSSKLQPRVTASSTEAEYLGLSHASKEAIHLSQLLSELAQGSGRPIELFADNQGANALSRDPQFHNRTCHRRLAAPRALPACPPGCSEDPPVSDPPRTSLEPDAAPARVARREGSVLTSRPVVEAAAVPSRRCRVERRIGRRTRRRGCAT